MKQNSSAEADSNYDGKVRLITVPALWMLVVAETSWELKPGLWCLGESRSGCSSLSDFIASHG